MPEFAPDVVTHPNHRPRSIWFRLHLFNFKPPGQTLMIISTLRCLKEEKDLSLNNRLDPLFVLLAVSFVNVESLLLLFCVMLHYREMNLLLEPKYSSFDHSRLRARNRAP